MDWYIWIWGITSTLGLGIWGALGIGLVAEEFKGWRARMREDEVSAVYRKLEQARVTIGSLERQLAEAKKGKNEYGVICP